MYYLLANIGFDTAENGTQHLPRITSSQKLEKMLEET